MFPNSVTEKLAAPVIEQLLSLDEETRYSLFLDYIHKAREVCLVQGEQGFIMLADEDGERLPVFPHRDLAQRWLDDMAPADSSMSQGTPVIVSYDEFGVTWLPGLQKNNVALVVFPVVGADSDHVVSAGELEADLKDSD